MALSRCAPNKVAFCAPVDAPVDGWRSYVVAVSAMVLQGVVFGCLNSFPNFKTQLLADPDLNAGEDAVAWASSLATGLGPLVSIIAGQVSQTASPRVTCLISAMATILSLNLAAGFANSEASLICLFGLFMGIAMGFMISSGPAAASTWFDKKMTLGMGIAFMGGGLGTALIPPISGTMEKVMDWRDAFHILTCFCSLSLIASLFVCIRPTSAKESAVEEEATSIVDQSQQPQDEEGQETKVSAMCAVVPPDVKGPAAAVLVPGVDIPFDIHVHPCHGTQWLTEAFFTPRFLALFAGYAFWSFGFYGSLYSVVPYPNLMGTESTPYTDAEPISISAASNSFIGLGLAEVLGTALFGYLSLKIGDRFSYAITTISIAILTACWTTCRDYWSHFLVVTLMGIFIIGFFATFGSMVAQSFYGPNLNRIMGVAYAAASIGGFAGAPAITAMVKSTGNQSYTMGLLVLAGSYLVSGLIVLIFIRDIPAAAEEPQVAAITDAAAGGEVDEANADKPREDDQSEKAVANANSEPSAVDDTNGPSSE